MTRRVLLLAALVLGGGFLAIHSHLLGGTSHNSGATGAKSQSQGQPATPQHPSTAVPATRVSAATGPDVIDRRACIDPTTSSAQSFAPNVVATLAADLQEWAPPTTQPSAAVPARPQLTLTVETVGTASLSTANQALELIVPAVPALAAPPGTDDPNLGAEEPVWLKAEAAWSTKAKAAAAAANLDALTLSRLPLDQAATNMSAIWQCLAGLADSAPVTPATSVLVASDLMNNEPAVPFSLSGATVLIDQSCPAQSVTSCPALAASWTSGLKADGASVVTVVPANVADSVLASWMEVHS